MTRSVDWRGLEFQVELLDVQQLNDRLQAGQFEIAKVSFHAALLLADRYMVLPRGAALGFGVGPLLLSRLPASSPETWNKPTPPVILCPGRLTTATLLYQLFFPRTGEIRQVVFSEILPALQQSVADFGVCIHEGRFTWRESGLSLVRDLGEIWEERTGLPLPLGGILGRRDLGADVLHRVSEVIGDSLEYGGAHRDEALSTMRQYAQEMDDGVLLSHVELYVNEQTRMIDASGRDALNALWKLAIEANLVPAGHRALEVVDG